MTTAFQPNALQPNAFQIDPPIPSTPPAIASIVNRYGRVPQARKLGIPNYIYMMEKNRLDEEEMLILATLDD
jgi:hypothetical protein